MATAETGEDLYGDRDRIAGILERGGTWAVVGLSPSRSRAAFGVSHFLIGNGIRVVPVHPSAQEVHGQPGYPTLTAAEQAVGPIDVVDLFVRSSLVGPLVDEAIAIGAKVVWMQQGVVDEAAARRARTAGLLTVMDQCPVQVWHLRRSAVAHGADPQVSSAVDVGQEVEGPACAWVAPG